MISTLFTGAISDIELQLNLQGCLSPRPLLFGYFNVQVLEREKLKLAISSVRHYNITTASNGKLLVFHKHI